jgi:hypothetical protein
LETTRILTAQKILSTIVITMDGRGFQSVEEKEIGSKTRLNNPRQTTTLADSACGKAEDGGG